MANTENIEIREAEYNNVEISSIPMNHRVKDMEISFIIPAHNAKETLDRAVYSIVRAMDCEKKYEIIIVENGSTDETAEAASGFAGIYPDIVKVAESKPGVSNARNKGLEMAAGKWIIFVDADDELLPEAYKAISEDLEEGSADLYLHSYMAGDRKIRICRKEGEYFGAVKTEEARVRMLCEPTHYMTVWSKLFRRDIIRHNHLHFRTDLRLSEDSEFLIRYTKHCGSIQMSDTALYKYSTDTASTVRSYDGRKTSDYLRALRFSTADIQGESSDIQRAYAQYVMMQFNLVMVHEVFAAENTATFAEKCRMMKKIAQHRIFRTALAGIPLKECNKARIAPAALLKAKLYPAAGAVYEARVYQNSRR